MNGEDSGQSNGGKGSQGSFEQGELKQTVESVSPGISSSMPNCQKAVTPSEKFINYSLDPSNPNASGKAEAYEKGLGYNKGNAKGLISQIHDYVTSGKKPYEVSQSEYGTKYKYRIPVTGPNGKTKNVIAVYQIDKGSSTPRLITNYLEGKR